MIKHTLLPLLAAGAVAGCGTIADTLNRTERQLQLDRAAGEYPKNSAIIPDATIKLTPSTSITLEKLLFTAAGAAAIYYIYDPLAPNWEIAEVKLGDGVYRLAMKMKRFHNGGDGEAMMVFKRRAADLKYAQGFADYEILEFQEGIESATLAAQRYSEGVIRLVGAVPKTAVPR